MSDDPLTCRDTTWLVSDGRERALTDTEHEALKAHLSTCTKCQGASQQFDVLFRGLASLLGRGPTDEASSGFRRVPEQKKD